MRAGFQDMYALKGKRMVEFDTTRLIFPLSLCNYRYRSIYQRCKASLYSVLMLLCVCQCVFL